jgi:hypothetical protein
MDIRSEMKSYLTDGDKEDIFCSGDFRPAVAREY